MATPVDLTREEIEAREQLVAEDLAKRAAEPRKEPAIADRKSDQLAKQEREIGT